MTEFCFPHRKKEILPITQDDSEKTTTPVRFMQKYIIKQTRSLPCALFARGKAGEGARTLPPLRHGPSAARRERLAPFAY